MAGAVLRKDAHGEPLVFSSSPLVKILSGSHVSLESALGLEHLLRALFPQGEFQTCNEVEMRFDGEARRILLVLPGSSEMKNWNFTQTQQELIDRLCRIGTLQILSVCAGSFYISRTIVYQGEERVLDHRYLKLFQGACVGPIVKKQDPHDLEIALGEISIGQQKVEVPINGGGHFLPDAVLQSGVDYEALAHYSDGTIPAIACMPRRGENPGYNAVLVGPHFEYEGKNFIGLRGVLPSHWDRLTEMATRVERSAQERLMAMHGFLQKLGFT